METEEGRTRDERTWIGQNPVMETRQGRTREWRLDSAENGNGDWTGQNSEMETG